MKAVKVLISACHIYYQINLYPGHQIIRFRPNFGYFDIS